MLSALRADSVDSASPLQSYGIDFAAPASRFQFRDFAFVYWASAWRLRLCNFNFAASTSNFDFTLLASRPRLREFFFAASDSQFRACGFGFAASALWLRLFDFGLAIWVRGFEFAASAISSTFRSCAFWVFVCKSFCLSWLFGNFSLRLRYSATELQ